MTRNQRRRATRTGRRAEALKQFLQAWDDAARAANPARVPHGCGGEDCSTCDQWPGAGALAESERHHARALGFARLAGWRRGPLPLPQAPRIY